MRKISLVVSCCILWRHVELAHSRPPCDPIDWINQTYDFPRFGTCNWLNSASPCGDITQKTGEQGRTLRAWPHGLCTLKFSRTPWAPEPYTGEEDRNFVCGKRYQVCYKGGNKLQPTFCGPGTAMSCADIEGDPAFKCEPSNNTTENLNCKGDAQVLVIDVSSMGFPNELSTRRVKDAAECADMCSKRSLCNVWNFCNSTTGCGWTCEDYYRQRDFSPKPKNKDLPIWAWVTIAVGTGALLFVVGAGLFYLCFYRRFKRQLSLRRMYSHTSGGRSITGTPPTKAHLPNSEKSESLPSVTGGRPPSIRPVLPAVHAVPPTWAPVSDPHMALLMSQQGMPPYATLLQVRPMVQHVSMPGVPPTYGALQPPVQVVPQGRTASSTTVVTASSASVTTAMSTTGTFSSLPNVEPTNAAAAAHGRPVAGGANHALW